MVHHIAPHSDSSDIAQQAIMKFEKLPATERIVTRAQQGRDSAVRGFVAGCARLFGHGFLKHEFLQERGGVDLTEPISKRSRIEVSSRFSFVGDFEPYTGVVMLYPP